MASNPTATLTALLQGATIEDHEDVLKAANAVLKSSKNQPEALHTRVVALLKLDRFDDALRALDEGGDKLAERCVLEKSYSLYKTGKLAEAEQLAQGKDSRGLLHVAAQVAYRQEEFEVAASLYKQLSAQTAVIEGEDNDLRINSSATDAQLEWQGNGDKVEPGRKNPGREDLEAFETSYNAACGCIARGDLAAGSVLLKRARDLCEALDELSGEEKRAEILPIMVQQAYVFTKLGKVEEAEAIQKMIQVADVPEPPTRVIAINNSLATSATENPYMSERIFESVPTLSHTDKLFEHQASLLRQNRYAIDLQSQKYPGVGRSTWSIISKSSSPTISPYLSTLSVLNAASFAKGETGKTALKRIQPLLEKRPNDVGLLLTIIQLYVLTDSPGSAIALLENFIKRLESSTTPTDLDVCFAPGITALLVSLYRICGRKAPIRVALAKAASHWRRKSSPSKPLLRAAGISLLDSSKAEDLAAAGEIFTSLRSQDPTDKVAIAGFVASYATTDLEKVSLDLEKLTPVSRLTAGIDASALEEAGVPSLPPSTFAPTTKKRAADLNPTPTTTASAPKKRKLRPSKLPKEYVEGKTPDPERWLPLRDRSSYRPKGKKGKKKAMEMTQGGVVRGGGEEGGESLELVGGAGSVRVEKSGGTGGGGGGAQQGKKKKKGKK